MRLPRSRIGWTLVAIYWIAAALLIHEAFTCSDWMCDLVEIPVTLPFGPAYLAVLQGLDPLYAFGSITYSPLRNWAFIVPTVAVNSVIYYWIGVGVGKVFARLRGGGPAR